MDMFFIDFINGSPEPLSSHTLVQAENKEELEVKIKAATKSESVSMLFVDSLDADNHDCDTYISINSYEYKANVYFVRTTI
jgi:hypothetical protein